MAGSVLSKRAMLMPHAEINSTMLGSFNADLVAVSIRLVIFLGVDVKDKTYSLIAQRMFVLIKELFMIFLWVR